MDCLLLVYQNSWRLYEKVLRLRKHWPLLVQGLMQGSSRTGLVEIRLLYGPVKVQYNVVVEVEALHLCTCTLHCHFRMYSRLPGVEIRESRPEDFGYDHSNEVEWCWVVAIVLRKMHTKVN